MAWEKGDGHSNQLAKLGFIETSRGRAGGLWISDYAGKASLKEIIQETERFDIAACFSKKDVQCTFRGHCLLKKSFREAGRAPILVEIGERQVAKIC